MTDLLRIFKALADKNRLLIMFSLMQYPELCACQITEFLEVTGATASKHLGILNNANLIQNRKDGRWIYYRLSDDIPTEIQELLQIRLGNSHEIKPYAKKIKKIVALKPEIICKKQRL